MSHNYDKIIQGSPAYLGTASGAASGSASTASGTASEAVLPEDPSERQRVLREMEQQQQIEEWMISQGVTFGGMEDAIRDDGSSSHTCSHRFLFIL